jgi:6-phosphofructokinase 2
MTAIVTVTASPALDISFTVERMVAEEKLRGTRPVMHPGGGGINVARVATRLGAEVMALWMGGGCDGRRLADLLDEEGVRHEGLPARDEPRHSLHVEEGATGAMYRFVLPGAECSEAEGARLVARVGELAQTSFLVLSGSLPPSLPADYYARLAARAPAGARVVLDTSGEALRRGLAGHVYLAKPNRKELAAAAGRALTSRDELVRAARELIDAGRVEVVAVSLGEDGLVVITGEGHEHVPAPKVTMVSAVGAGDSTVAGIVVGLVRGLPLGEAARLGAAAGAAAVLSEGTELGSRQDTERLFAALRGAGSG